MKYIPSPGHAWESLQFINTQVLWGGFVRGLHFFGASAMVLLVFVHMSRVVITGSYKFPREVNWITGVVLLFLTLAMAFTGQLLRWDADGVWGVFVAAHYAARVPLIGEALKQFMLGGATVGGATLSRFYAFHVILMPLAMFAVIGLHMYLVLHHGISEPPEPGRPVDPKSYRRWYQAHLTRQGRPYFPDAVWKEAVAALLVVVTVVALAWALGPKGPGERADPTMIPSEPKPDWFLLWYYGLLSIKPPRIETFTMVYLPAIAVLILILLPLLSGRGERSPSRRPWSIAVLVFLVTAFGVLTELGGRAPWVMDFGTEPLPAHAVGFEAGPVWQGAALFHERGCQYCHVALGEGGDYGPALTDVMRRLPPEVVTTRIVQGFGNMPAYRDILTREELAAILAFLHSLSDER
jgi:ubiquinol-cytochrome c reductase cytochrome b subunit